MSRTENSRKIAQFIKSHPSVDWEKIMNAKPGDRQLDAILIFLFHSKNRIITTTNFGRSLGTVDKKSKVIIDFVPETEGLNLEYSSKGFAVFSYETVLDELFEYTHLIDFKAATDAGLERPANRAFFKSTQSKEDLEDYQLEF